jgi:hypothetical protein
LRRFDRPVETAVGESAPVEAIPFDAAEAALATAPLSPGSRALLRALLRLGSARVFPGGGVGIEYGSLLKTAVRPDVIGEHIREAADHLREHSVDLLLVPGMSGYPVGAMYAYAARLPAVLLKKQKLVESGPEFPSGAFVIPSYTGDGDMIISADLDAVRDIVAPLVLGRLAAASPNDETLTIALRCAGADDVIDKGAMARGITESAPLICSAAIAEAIAEHRSATGDSRPIVCRAEVVTWVTPLIKTYHGAASLLERSFGITPFAGLSVTSVHLDPPSIGIDGAGVFAFRGA